MSLYICRNHRMNSSRVNPDVNHGLWAIMTCRCRFTDCNKRASLMGDVDSQGGSVHVGTLLFLFNFAVNLKLPLKNKVFELKYIF